MTEECTTEMEVRRFLGACAFYYISIPHYAHVAEPLYGLLKKKRCCSYLGSTAPNVCVVGGTTRVLNKEMDKFPRDYKQLD
jgi:hypothetical protein